MHFGSFRAFRDFWKSTVTFNRKNDTGHYLESGIQTPYEDFEKRFRIPANFAGEPPQLTAQPPIAVAKNKFQTSISFPYLIVICFY